MSACPGGKFEEQLGQLFLAPGLHRGAEQRLLVGEMAVHRELGNPGVGGDGVHAAAGIAVANKQAFGRCEDGFALGEIFGATGAAGLQ